MKSRRDFMPYVALIITALLLMGTLLPGRPMPATAAPAAVLTPVSSSAQAPTVGVITYWNNSPRTADGGSTAQNTRNFQRCAIQWNVDTTVVNTTTLKLQLSNDNVYWADQATLQSTIIADSGLSTTGSANLTEYYLNSRYSRVYADVTNSSPITITVIGTCR